MATLKRVDDSFEIPDKLPAIALRDLVFFPYMVLPLLIGRPRSAAALDEAEENNRFLLLLAQRDPDVEEPERGDLYRVGTVVRLLQVTRLPDGTARVVMEGLGRARVQRFLPWDSGFRCRVELLEEGKSWDQPALTSETEALIRGVERMYQEYAHLHDRVPSELGATLAKVSDRVRLVHLMAGHLLVEAQDKQALLEAQSLRDAYEGIHELLVRELEILHIEEKLDRQIHEQMDSDRKQHYLQEQLKAIHAELGSGEGEHGDLESEIRGRVLPEAAQERVDREMTRLRQLNPAAPEASVIRTYLDWVLGMPWGEATEDNLDVGRASTILEDGHFGLEEVKERILDHIAVLSLVGSLQGPILCLVCPPGVGKTSLGRSIGKALGRSFARVSLGGVRDEAEIRGHRRTYVGALPGRILQGIRRAGSCNPVFLLDEVDKLARDFHGDPGAALLEVLDPEQNRSFTDHYLELEFDLSEVLFVATANTLAGIPEPMRDRMEIIRIPGYLDTEKSAIAERFLWPKEARKHGLPEGSTTLSVEAIQHIITNYTREAGVRELDRRISRVARKVAREMVGGDRPTTTKQEIGVPDLQALLGPPTYAPPSRDQDSDRAGIAHGLAWTSAGGEILDVEVAVVPGSGDIRLTGTLGDVMKESAFAGVTYARSRARRLGLGQRFHSEIDVHIHIPEGATPKDGPSAGITIAVALISALTNTPTRADVALTGEITLRGRVLPVGGIKEKLVAALRSGMHTVILPAANEPELQLLPQEVKDGLEFVTVTTMDEVLRCALLVQPGSDLGIAAELVEGSGVHRSQ